MALNNTGQPLELANLPGGETPSGLRKPWRTAKRQKHLDAVWETFFSRLLEFKQQHGHFHIPHWDPRYQSLYYWSIHQHTFIARGTLPPERRRRLEAAGFPGESYLDWLAAKKWDPIWNRHFEELKAFHARHGHFHITTTDPQLDKLREWAHHQRRKFSSGKLRSARREQLAAIGFFESRPSKHQLSLPR